MTAPSEHLRASSIALALVLLWTMAPTPASAQLRPLPPLPWDIFEPGTNIVAAVGAGVLHDQRAALAGTRGDLIEAGDVLLAWRSGRIAIEMGGTLHRSYQVNDRYTDPHPVVSETADRRSDVGNFRIGTLVRISPENRPAMLLLRFGTQLPNSDDTVGLDRDRMDFYALLGGQLRYHRLLLEAEAGMGIHGTHNVEYDQADPFLYVLGSEYALGPAALQATFLGQRSGFGGWVQRGNESLSELRVGASAGGRIRVELLHVIGFATHSPGRGWLLSVSSRW